MATEHSMKLVLEDGTVFPGHGFGAAQGVAGEVVFNTAMCGYVESLTDPSYRGQILVLTYPLVGNYGVPPDRPPGSLDGPFESGEVQAQGLIVQNYCSSFSHHAAARSLGEWLRQANVPAATGIDTRALTRHLRSSGTMKGRLLPTTDPASQNAEPLETEMTEQVFWDVAPARACVYGDGARTVLLVDVGAKDNIVRSLLTRGVRVVRVPWHGDLRTYHADADAVVIGNGPGNPADLESLTAQVREMVGQGKPILGICLGNQILARAVGARTYKLAYGHRGVNQPVRDLISGRCAVTSQNHGYAVDSDTLPADWEAWFVNLNDGSNEGIRSRTRPFLGVQFHPEARPGPEDTGYLFDEFIAMIPGTAG